MNENHPASIDVRRLFERAGAHAAAFRQNLDERPQRPDFDYAKALALFEQPLPERGDGAESVLDDLVRRATPGLHATAGRRFFGWVIGGSHPLGVAADWLTAAWG